MKGRDMNHIEVTPQDFKLGNSARVNIDAALLKEGTDLSFKKKKALRIEIVKAYIRSKPAGTRILITEFAELVNLKKANCDTFIKSLVKKKIIGRENISNRRFSYFIPGDAVTVKEPTVAIPKDIQTIVEKTLDPAPVEYDLPVAALPYNNVVEAAKTFAWINNSDSLREFVSWYTSPR